MRRDESRFLPPDSFSDGYPPSDLKVDGEGFPKTEAQRLAAYEDDARAFAEIAARPLPVLKPITSQVRKLDPVA